MSKIIAQCDLCDAPIEMELFWDRFDEDGNEFDEPQLSVKGTGILPFHETIQRDFLDLGITAMCFSCASGKKPEPAKPQIYLPGDD